MVLRGNRGSNIKAFPLPVLPSAGFVGEMLQKGTKTASRPARYETNGSDLLLRFSLLCLSPQLPSEQQGINQSETLCSLSKTHPASPNPDNYFDTSLTYLNTVFQLLHLQKAPHLV